LLADEPTSALDVSVQAQILALFKDLQQRLGLSIIFVSHSLGALAAIADRLAILYLGRLVEIGPTAQVLSHPLHPYTQALRAAVITPDPRVERNRKVILLSGEPPSPLHPPTGCPFHPRCHFAVAECQLRMPVISPYGERQVACIRASEWSQ
jgi:oligopeptide/dipeptide ABC transporter ATP-binding protein